MDKEMIKKNLQAKAQISQTSVTKMSQNPNVSMDILLKVCEVLNCWIEDVIEFVSDDATKKYNLQIIYLMIQNRKSGTTDENF